MSQPSPEAIWSSSDYEPTARRLAPAADVVSERVSVLLPQGSNVVDLGAGHGHLAEALLERGFAVTAVEPTARMMEVGRTRVPNATWVQSTGEQTGLDDASVDGIASSFGSMFCDPSAGPSEWARILAPGGALVMTAWTTSGFLAEMTDRMMAVLNPGSAVTPSHMLWGEAAIAEERLAPHFRDVQVEYAELPWNLSSVGEGMELYLHGSPTHAASLEAVGDRRAELLTALRTHLEESVDPDGAVRASTGYCVITARR